MIKLYDLKKLAKQLFPEADHSTGHLLVAWAKKDDDCELLTLLKGTGLDPDRMSLVLEPLLDDSDPQDRNILIDAISTVSGEDVKGVHLLIALCSAPDNYLTRALVRAGLDCDALLTNIQKYNRGQAVLGKMGIDIELAETPLLRYGRNLTELAAQGTFSDLYPRVEEMNLLTDVLQRKRKGNAIITGEAGVGKTAMVELLASEIVRGQQPLFDGYRIYEISLGKLVAGTKYRGEFEERFETIMGSLSDEDRAILFLDEIHLIVGAGRAEGIVMDGSNLIKPFLVRDSFRVIGATTHEEYQRYIAQDPALARRFHEIRLSEPEDEILYSLIKHQAEVLARHHHVQIPDAIIKRAIELTNRYLPNRAQPDKSLDLLDSAAVGGKRDGYDRLDLNNLMNACAKFTGLSISTLSGEDKDTLKSLVKSLKSRIVAQDAVIESIVPSLVHRRIDIGNPERPIGVYLFAGDTGVGKTELARAISSTFFGNGKKLLHLDMSEYADASSVNKLIGAPPGYIGSDQEGILIKWLHREASGVIVLDEIEKAAPEIHKLLLGLLDNGRIASATGSPLSARSCVIILTTNAVTSKDLNRPQLGFGQFAGKKPNLHGLLSRVFPRELLSRMDEIFAFHSLTREDMLQILRLRLKEAIQRLERKYITLIYDENRLLEFLFKRLQHEANGARGVARLLERNLIQPLAMQLLYTEEDSQKNVFLGDRFYREGKIEIIEAEVRRDSHG